MSITLEQELVAFHYELGRAITQWAHVEWDLHLVTAHCFDNRRGAFGRNFYDAFFSIENFRAKLKFADTVVKGALRRDPLLADWAPLVARLVTGATSRNRLAHYPVTPKVGNRPGRIVALAPRIEEAVPSVGKGAPKQPTGALFIRDVARARLEFSALGASLMNFAARARGLPREPFPKSDEQPQNPPTAESLVAQMNEALGHRRKPSRQ